MLEADEAIRLAAAGLARYKLKDMDGAIEAYSRAVAADPQCQEAQKRLFYALQERQDMLSEVERARERLAVHPGNVRERFRLAQRLEALGLWTEAIAELVEVLRQDGAGTWGKSAEKILQKRSQQASAQMLCSPSARQSDDVPGDRERQGMTQHGN